ncbi:MAG: glyoxalase family protein [Chloroflexota bacterium]|nr:glyoxalase family protein [Chloroflexota bacterium]
MPATVPGIHHVTAIAKDVQRTVDFYVSVLGLRFIKKTVNFDVPDTYHIYFGDRVGTPGSAMTFFGWPHLAAGQAGTGQVAVVSFAVPPGSLDYWERRIREHGVETARDRRFDTDVLALRDPDGIRIELVGEASEDRWAPWPEGPVAETEQIRSFHSIALYVRDGAPSAEFLTGVMGFREAGRERQRVRYVTGEGGPHSILDLLVKPDAATGEELTGTVHHVAWRALDDDHQLAWRTAVVEAGREITPVIERKYFRSIYFREPGGVLFEIATDGPGFTVDEPAESLGTALQLPPQHEHKREGLDYNLVPIVVPAFKKEAPI